MRYSEHASKRCCQRALPEDVLDLVMALGDEFKSRRGTRIKALVSNLARNEFLQELESKGIRPREKWCEAYLVLSPCGKVITVGYRYKKLLNHVN